MERVRCGAKPFVFGYSEEVLEMAELSKVVIAQSPLAVTPGGILYLAEFAM